MKQISHSINATGKKNEQGLSTVASRPEIVIIKKDGLSLKGISA